MKSAFAIKMADLAATVYVVEGQVTDTDAHGGGGKLGDPEWQFSDGPPGARGTSEDYIDLMEGLRDFEGCNLVFDFAPAPLLDHVFCLTETVTYHATVKAHTRDEARAILLQQMEADDTDIHETDNSGLEIED